MMLLIVMILETRFVMSIIDNIDGYGKKYEKRIAHINRDGEITYRELYYMSDALAAYLAAELMEDRTPIIVYGHKQHEMLICFLACVKSGHAYIPVDSSQPDERVKRVIESSGVKFIFSVSQLNFHTEGILIKYTADIRKLIEQYSGSCPPMERRIGQEDTYYIIYTSGSTGIPKGVQITLSCLESFTNWGLKICNLCPERNYVFMNQAPFSFDLSVMDLYISLESGSTLCSIDKEMTSNMHELFQYFSASKINIWVSTPSFAQMCLSDKSFNEKLLPGLELFLFCGEVLPNACVRGLHERFKNARIINTYGPTEATVAVTSVEIDNIINKKYEPLPVGYVKHDCRIFIVDPDGDEVPAGEKGEIIIAGKSVSTGYYKNQEMTDRLFSTRLIDGSKQRCYKTGDQGYIRDGLLFFSGRADYQVKLNGYRIELEDIENNLRKIDFIDNAVVLPVSKENRIQYLAAVVTINRVIDESEFKTGMLIKSELKTLLPEYMIPRKIVIRDSLPMTVNGKVNRRELLEEFK